MTSTPGGDVHHRNPAFHIDDFEPGIFLVGNEKLFLIRGKGKNLGAGPRQDIVDDFERSDVDNIDHVIIAAGNIQQRLVAVEMHIARPTRGFDALDDFIVGVEHDDLMALFVRHENEARASGKSRWHRRKKTQRAKRRGDNSSHGYFTTKVPERPRS
jgi:hypothetical protein